MIAKFNFENPVDKINSSNVMISLNRTIGCFTLINSIKLILIIGSISIAVITILITTCFRSAILTIILPITVIIITIYGIVQQKHFCLWPIIGISCFHIILTLYFDLFFLYFFIFKPNYIIMVLNWMFDTLYTKVTPLFFVQCTVIIILTTIFGLFNLWQLHISIVFKKFLKQQTNNKQ